MALDPDTGLFNTWSEGLPVEVTKHVGIDVSTFTFWSEGLPFLDTTQTGNANFFFFF